ncbi:MMPL family transporter [Sediminibacillus albus]|uniref:Putative drug exporter of the RND superfamily n=1 Tax=Sediminibacillus albus TaxID=407036 RepID=A0A1G9CA94_9BACI|nr:MMPL family transporter [Sediminibacillus albus]SDK48577.1 putative drug exporter of the RND superfamily [Sediminibacillus albus]
MRKIIQFRWVIFVIWIAAAAALLLLSPNLQELVRDKGQIGVPEGYSSTRASELLEQMSNDDAENTTSAVMVFHEEKSLTASQKDDIAEGIDRLQSNQEDLGISNVLSFRDDERIEEQVVSEDGTTIMVPMTVSLADRDIDQSRDVLYEATASIDVDHLLTGEEYISQDILVNSEEGLKKTEYITVAIILIILFLVFRSLVAPFIPLLTVGISYLAAQGIVSILADTADFPLSTFTQIFMVAVMFGIGTDYCILLISRFKEELANYETTKEAVLATYKAAGKTIFFAGLAVLIGFSTIGFSTFSLYQSAVAVAVGVAVVLLALATLVPFFLVVLGKKLFWPFDKNVSHKESKLWGSVGTFAWTRPLIAMIIVLVVAIPSIIAYNGQKSYNSLEEIGDDYGSVKAFNWIADSVGPGQAMPATVVLESDKKIESPEDYQEIELISQQIAALEGVDQVRSATRPAGEVIEDFTVDSQTEQLSDGIGESTNGIDEIQTGFADAASQLEASQPQLEEAASGVDQLMAGTQEANDGIGEMQTALSEIQSGIASGAKGAGEIRNNLETIQANLQQTIQGNRDLLEGYQGLEQGITSLVQGYQSMEQILGSSLQGFNRAEQNNPALSSDQDFQTAKGQLAAVVNGTSNQPGLSGLNDTLEAQVLSGLQEANSGLNSTIDAQSQLSDGIAQLISGTDDLQNGLNQAAAGQQQVVNGIPSLQDGLTQIYGGQEELKDAFSDMQGQLSELSSGLHEGAGGLVQISDGLSEVQSYLDEFSTATQQPTVNIPEEAVENEDFQEGIKPYLSDSKTVTTFEVVLSDSPYATESVNFINDIEKTVNGAKAGTIFENADTAIAGISSTNNDLQEISDQDYSRTVIYMLAGIFIILILLLRSLIMPIYLIGSLILTYYTSMGVGEIIFVNIMGYEGISWAVPFFAFVILVALGIDYSIFLMDRFNENHSLPVKDALLSAMKNMGTVIISAAVILGGTFGAMMPAGVLSLLQIATVVLTGLFLYAFIMLPLFIPVMVRLFNKANWWPFHRKETDN